MNASNPSVKKLTEQEVLNLYRVLTFGETAQKANAHYKLGKDYYYYHENESDRLRNAESHFQEALKMELKKAEKYLALIALQTPDTAVKIFEILGTEQVCMLEEQKSAVYSKMEDLKSEISKLTPMVGESLETENDVKKLQVEHEILSRDFSELNEGRKTMMGVVKDAKAIEWEKNAAIPVVNNIKKLDSEYASYAKQTCEIVYENEKLNSETHPKESIHMEEALNHTLSDEMNDEIKNEDIEENDGDSQENLLSLEDEKSIDKFLKYISSKDTIEEGDKKKLLEVSRYLQKILEDIGNLFYDNDANIITVLVGPTAAGKSTICRWLTDQQMESIEIKDRNGHFTFRDTDDTDGGATSKTKQPQIKNIKRVDNSVVEYYGDCPGFHDTRGILQKIKNFFYIQHLFKNRNIKFLLAIPLGCFEIHIHRGKGVVDAFTNLLSMIKDPEKLISNNSISLIVTHCPVGDNNQKWIEDQLKILAKTQNSVLSKLMLHVDSKKIAFFSLPVESRENYQTHDQSIDEKQKLLQILSEINFLPLEKEDINFSPSFSKARLLLRQLSDNLQDHMENLLTPYASSVKDHIDAKRKNFNTRVEELVNKGLNYYKPMALFNGLPQEFEDLCGPEITEKVGARNNRLKRFTIGGGIVLFVVTVGAALPIAATAAITTVPVVGIIAGAMKMFSIPIFATGVAGGVAGGAATGFGGGALATIGTFWFSKTLWGDFLRNEFKKKEAKIHKENLFNYISQLQNLKNSILNNNDTYYFDSPTFDPPLSNPLNFSKIKNTTQLLHFICNLQQRDNNILSHVEKEIEKIWKRTFLRVTDTIVTQLCETDDDFYDKESPPAIKEEISMEKILPIYTSLPFGDLSKQLNENGLSHISVEFVDLVLRNSEDLLAGQKSIYPPLEEKKIHKVIHYMELCKCIYTDHNTKSFVQNNLPFHITKIWQDIILKKKEVDRLYKNLERVQNQNDSIFDQSIIYEGKGKNVESRQLSSISSSELIPNIQENYINCIKAINVFLIKIGETPFPEQYNALEFIGSAIGDLENIQNKIKLELEWHFNQENDNNVVSHQSTVSTSFLNKSLPYLNRKKNREIVILQVGFRNLKKLEGICNVIRERLLSFKDNPQAWFDGEGEVDYIAYIERDLSQNHSIKDKLVIVYSGSNSIEDWKTNTNISNAEFCDLNVHEGIGSLIEESTNTYFSNLTDKICHFYSTRQKPQKFKIVTTGHSLGGALALLAAYYYKQEHIEILSNELNIAKENIYVKCYTFAAPAIIADKDSQEKIENFLGKNNIFVTWNYHVLSIF